MPRTISRRTFLAATAGSIASLPVLARGADAGSAAAEEFSFFLVGDTHYLADKQNPQKLTDASARTTARLIDQLNRLSGTDIPQAAGGGTVLAPMGVIHAGDLIDSGDKNGGVYPQMQQTEWAAYAADYGLSGRDGRLRYPVYEVHGNHDGPSGNGLVVQKIIERNKSRPAVANVSANGLHYSWDWGGVHFVNLGIVVGAVKDVPRKRRYNPLDSLEFLVADLARHVGNSKRPVILTHHVDVARYSTPPEPGQSANGREWDPADVHAYHETLAPYKVLAILYGHTHVRNVFKWDGTPARAQAGMQVFNVDNSAHFGSDSQGIFYFHYRGGVLTARELVTRDRWQTVTWTPQTWSVA